jgi:hypothetical protein
MRRMLIALGLFLSFALPDAANADSFQYTIVWDFPHIGTADTSEFLGTYSFTVDSRLYGDTFVYGPNLPIHNFGNGTIPYIFAPDFTVPAGSNVSEIEIFNFPDTIPNPFGYAPYGVALNQVGYGAAVAATLSQDPSDPNKFFVGDSGDGSGDFVSLQITQVSTSPVPEPSTIALSCIGMLAVGVSGLRSFYKRRGQVAHI